jgi:hypothetical protein
MDFWVDIVTPRFPHLLISQNDVSALRPRREGDVSGEGPLDFLVEDKKTKQLVFGIENKTGRSALKEMSQFQLDVSDCDAILYHVKQLKVPAFIVHAQVLELWKPPTMGFRIAGLWWSDIYRMTEQFKKIMMRRDEQRGAAFFARAAFSAMDTFVDELYDERGALKLVERFNKEGIPSMYKSS